MRNPRQDRSAHLIGLAFATLASFVSQVTQAADATSDQAALQEVVVTAQKREERLQDVPVAVTAISADTLLSQNMDTLQDYVRAVPGFSLDNQGNGQTTLVLRGISTGGLTNATVGVTVDDVPFGSTLAVTYGALTPPDLDPTNLARIEVLRGPQGTLYGAATLGGLLKYVTSDPSLTDVRGHVSAGADTVSDGSTGYAFRGAVDLPAIPNVLGFSLSALDRRDAGFIDDPTLGLKDVNSVTTTGGRAAMLWKPSDAVSLKIQALLQEINAGGVNSIDTNGLLSLSGGLNQDRLISTGPYNLKTQLYSANLSANFGSLTLTSISGYNINEYNSIGDFPNFYGLADMVFGVNGSGVTNAFRNKKFSEELRLASGQKGTFEWLIGAFYSHDDTSSVQTVPAIDPNTGATAGELLVSDFPDVLTEVAGFGDLTIHFTDSFNIQFGARESQMRQTYNETDSGALIGGTVVQPTSHTKDNAFTYLIAPQYKFSPDLMAYARVASGYRPGGPNPSAAALNLPPTFGPDKTTNYELGLKGEFLDHRVAWDLAGYYINWTDVQIQQTDPTTDFAYFTNAGKATSDGAELSIQARPTEGLTLTATMAYNDATLSEALPPGAYGPKGADLPFTSHFTASLSANQNFHLTNDLTGFVGLSAYYVGSRFGNFPSAPPPTAVRPEFPRYALLNLRTGVQTGRWTVTVYADNVTNKLEIISAAARTFNQAADAPWTGVVLTPRTVGLTLNAQF
jgi:outer membrane receptor protein involved in Fe transport